MNNLLRLQALASGLVLLAFSQSLLADDLIGDDFIDNVDKEWQSIEHNITLATRLSHHKAPTAKGEIVSESTAINVHHYNNLVLAWRLDNQLYQTPDHDHIDSETEFELSELFYSFSLLESENDFWQIGQFNAPLDPGYALRSVGFFESSNNPFDDFASTQGLKMANLAIWLDDYYLNVLVALEGNSVATKDLKQWALVLQTDYQALSSSYMFQQYENSSIGLGSTFTYVIGNHWEFHGSAFLRQGSVWQAQFSDSALPLPNYSDSDWFPKAVLGSVWTNSHLQLIVEYSYQKEKLSNQQIDDINDIEPQTAEEGAHYQNNVYQLYTQAYQQHYFFAQLQYTIEDHIITANSLIGQDISALSQLKYEYLTSLNSSAWLSVEIASGKNETEFKRIPWQNRVQIGLQWKI